MQFVLDATNKTITGVLGGTVATNQPEFTAAWADDTGSSFTEGSSNGVFNNATPVTIVAAPAAATRRIIKSITVQNKDTASITMTLKFDEGGTGRNIAVMTLAAGDTFTLEGVYDNAGRYKTIAATSVGGSDTQVQYNNSGAFGGITGATSNGTTLTITSGRATTDFSPTTNDGATLGTTSLQFADLFLASGGVINFANGNYTLTHSTGLLTASGPFSVGTSNAITTGTIELGAATDTTLSRSAAGVLAVEGVVIPSVSSTNTLTNKTLSNAVEPATDDTYTGEELTGILAGDTIAQWDLVYLDPTSGRWEFTDADAATTAGQVFLGLATGASTDGNALTVVTRGVVRNDGWTWSGAGKPLYVSTTAKEMTETAPTGTDDVVRIVGYTMSDDCIFFCPSNDWITRT